MSSVSWSLNPVSVTRSTEHCRSLGNAVVDSLSSNRCPQTTTSRMVALNLLLAVDYCQPTTCDLRRRTKCRNNTDTSLYTHPSG